MDISATQSVRSSSARAGIRSTLFGVGINLVLAVVKAVAGVVGHSYALVADAIESASDVLTSLIVLAGLKMAGKPADTNHPYGHGKFEPMAAVIVGLTLIGAGIAIAIESMREIASPHHAPRPFTLAVLVLVVIVKELLFRYVVQIGEVSRSTAVQADAWHHRSDALTSAAALVGISIALIGGEGYESADDFAAMIAAGIIVFNAVVILKPALAELLDAAPDPQIAKRVREIAHGVEGVLGTHKCNVRKLGFDYFVDLDVLCDPEASIRRGHEVAHDVGEAIHASLPFVTKVLVHVEPADDYGRRSRDI